MKIAITGICGFAGGKLARRLLQSLEGATICGMDNLLRPGSEMNRGELASLGIRFYHGDVRMASRLRCAAGGGLGDRRSGQSRAFSPA